MTAAITDNPAQQRYELIDGGQIAAFAEYVLHGSVADFVHTQTVRGHEGHGLASTLVRGALDDARQRGWQVRPYCPFVRAYLVDHPEYRDLVPSTERVAFGLA